MKLRSIRDLSIKTTLTFFTLAIFVIGAWSIAFYYDQAMFEKLERLEGERQFAAVSLLAAQVDKELAERIGALENFARRIQQQAPKDPGALQAMLENQLILTSAFNGGAMVVGADGIAIADIPRSEGRAGINYADRDYIITVMREGKTTIGKPIVGRKSRTPSFPIAAPISDAGGKTIGILVGITDLDKPSFLSEITQSRYGKTGGYLITSPKHRLIVTATDKSRIMEELPPEGQNPTIDRLTKGHEGPVVFVNRLGVELLTSGKSIPTAGWRVVAVLPTEEAFAPIRDMRLQLLIGTVVLTVLAGALVWWVTSLLLRRKLAPMRVASQAIRRLPGAEQPFNPLPVTNQDEIGTLVGEFNQVLGTLAQRDKAVKDGNETLTSILGTTPDGFLRIRGDGSILDANLAYCQLSGYSRDELLRMKVADLEAKESGGEVAEHVREIASSGRGRFETAHRRKDGTTWQVEVITTYRDADGGQFLSFLRDISERKRSEVALRESELRYRRLAEKSPLAIQQLALDGTTFNVNAAWEKLWRVPLSALQGYSIFSDPQLEKLGFLPLLRRVFAGESVEFPEHMYDTTQIPDITGGPGKLWLRAFAYAVKDDDGQVTEVVLVQEDITERKLAEEARQQSESRFRSLVENAPDVLYTWSERKGGIYYSPQVAAIFGYTADQLVSRPFLWAESIHPDDRQVVAEAVRQLRDGKSFKVEYRVQDARGQWRWLFDRSIGSRLEGDELVVEGLAMDITERKQLEADLQSLYQSIESRREEDRRKIARELHDDLGHRLTTLRMDIDRLEGKVAQRDPETAAKLEALGEEVITVVDAVRRISEDLRPGILDALGLVAALEDLVSRFSKRTDIRCEMTSSHEEFAVADGIAIGVYRIAQEALNNAMKYANATEIRVALDCTDDEINLVVQDNGKGLPEPTTGRRQGFGLLGMRERVIHLNGRVTISSEPGAGVRIEAVIPTPPNIR